MGDFDIVVTGRVWGLDFHAFSSHNGKGCFAFGGEAFLAPLPIFVRERIPDQEPASHPRLHGPFHYARANVQKSHGRMKALS